jgi:hypothetical protein
MSGVNHLLDYCSTHPEANIRYYALSDMQLKIHSDASYIFEPNSNHVLVAIFTSGPKRTTTCPHINATYCSIQPSSIAEAKCGAVFNAKAATVTRVTLTEMGSPQEVADLKKITPQQMES